MRKAIERHIQENIKEYYTFFSTSYGNIDWHICIK